MKTHHVTIIVLALAVAGGAGAWSWHHRFAALEKASPQGNNFCKSRPTGAAQGAHPPRPGKSGSTAKAETLASASLTPQAVVAMAASHSTGWPAVIPVISERELQRRAAKVEQEANHDLKHLVGLLGLDEVQQDRIFDTLVRHSPEWHPAMQPVGVIVPGPGPAPGHSPVAANGPDMADPGESSATAGTGTLLDAIAKDLSSDQQAELANAELDRQEWWQSIIAQLLPESDTPLIHSAALGEGNTGSSASAAPPQGTGGPAEIKSGDEPGILVE